LDPVADVLGLALYGEVTTRTNGLALEGKLIVDKKVGPWLFAGNLVAEQEWLFGLAESERELGLEVDLAGTYFVTEKLGIGLEVRNHNSIPGNTGRLRYSALFAGPTISYAERRWWVAASFLPQLPAIKKSEPQNKLVLDDHERYNARIILSFHL
jgi:hypothetical protein